MAVPSIALADLDLKQIEADLARVTDRLIASYQNPAARTQEFRRIQAGLAAAEWAFELSPTAIELAQTPDPATGKTHKDHSGRLIEAAKARSREIKPLREELADVEAAMGLERADLDGWVTAMTALRSRVRMAVAQLYSIGALAEGGSAKIQAAEDDADEDPS